MSDADHGASAAAVDAMDMLGTDPQPDTELHLQLSPVRAATADDSTRADMLLIDVRDALRKYGDVRVAAADGFEELPGPAGKHSIHHLSNWAWASAESRGFNPAKPTSLLYRDDADGTLRLTGAMYTAPASASVGELDQRIPVSFARWHRHVHWCTPGTGSGAQWLAMREGSPQYGPRSPVATRDACAAENGVFYNQVFGWMVHVAIVGSDDPAVVWRGGLATASPADTATPHVVAAARDTAGHAAVVAPATALVTAPVRVPASVPATSKAPAPSPAVPVPVTQNPAAAGALVTKSPAPPVTASITVPVARQSPVSPRITAVATADTIIPPAHPHPASVLPGRTVFAAPVSSAGSFQSGGTAVAFDRIVAAGSATGSATGGATRRPAVILLHDAQGLAQESAFLHDLAMVLVQRGYDVDIVHYLDRSAMTTADGEDRRAHFREWVGTVRDAVSDLARSPGVDTSRIGVVGTGLGGTLALTAGATDPRIKAVAEYGAAIPARAASLVQRMPPVLIMHGDKDRAVPLMEAYRIRAICKAVQAPAELEVFYGQNHVIEGADADALRGKTVAFLDKYIGAR
jgi:dienelactone hydrolase